MQGNTSSPFILKALDTITDILYNEAFQKQRIQIFVSALKCKYPSSNLIDNEFFEMNSVDADKFIDMIDKLFVDDGSVQCGDVLDFRKVYKKKL